MKTLKKTDVMVLYLNLASTSHFPLALVVRARITFIEILVRRVGENDRNWAWKSSWRLNNERVFMPYYGIWTIIKKWRTIKRSKIGIAKVNCHMSMQLRVKGRGKTDLSSGDWVWEWEIMSKCENKVD